MNSFYFDKMHMLYNQNKSCVMSCQKHCLKNPLFSKKKRIVFKYVHFFYPIVLKRKIITDRVVKDADRWWIGLTDSGQEGTWVWLSDFEVATFTDWAPGMPSVTSRSK